MKIAIIGLGVVGRAQLELFEGHELVTYDPVLDEKYPYADIADCHCAVICVGTPAGEDGHTDLSAVRSAVAMLPQGVPALLRSTVPPGTTDELRGARLISICHCPEFLHEREGGQWRTSRDVPFVILGGEPGDRELFRPLLQHAYGRGYAPLIHQCTAKEAEMAKYVANLYWATRVTFVSEMAAIAKAAGVDWEMVRRAWITDWRVGDAYTSMQGFEPGFGGRCWPKDLAALIAAARDLDYHPGFLESIQEANERFRG